MPLELISDEKMKDYLSGSVLYGDNFNLDQCESWYRDEAEGYANLGAREAESYQYVYHALNWWHGFRKIKLPKYIDILGFGSAYGEELKPLLKQARSLTIVDSSNSFQRDSIESVPCQYIKPKPSGELDFQDQSFDFVSTLGVLHHIPNVTAVMNEITRVIRPGGYLLLREPMVSMGDWRVPRKGLTKHERGIPLQIMRQIVSNTGLNIISESYCIFPLLGKICKKLRSDVYNSRLMTCLDAFVSQLFKWNINYHPLKFRMKFRPTSVYYVLQKAP